jgi:hypothetical protein
MNENEFVRNGVTYVAVDAPIEESVDCHNVTCDFFHEVPTGCTAPMCSAGDRIDGRYVIFKVKV